ncbi:MAG: sigma-54-dependent Fis family transcriptional regulator [Bacteroidales bacterium]|nr:sigma-54-dependent Fis family transcriptional regulator [Candidatus Liminaster caballi]
MNSEVLQVQQSLGIVGKSPLLGQAISAAINAAPFDVNVLVVGENGSGKEVFHKILHNYSRRRMKKCIPVNCAALPDGTINSELFGHVKGAFTGATADRKGFFEEADGGTIFLDEVGELPLDTQARLLRVLETGEYLRMGSNEVRKTDVRVVAATNRDLLKAIADGKFREDLFYRLSTITIKVPALRERPEDIHLLFRKFASDASYRYNVPAISVDDSARLMLLAYQWPGNVRQLLHLVEELSIVQMERVITADILKQHLPTFESRISVSDDPHSSENGFGPGEKKMLYNLIMNMQQQIEELRQHIGMAPRNTQAQPHTPHVLTAPETPADIDEQEAEEVPMTPVNPPSLKKKDMERDAIEQALRNHGGNKRKAAEEVGISERTMHRKIKEYGLDKKY